jgi:hypothetical protein
MKSVIGTDLQRLFRDNSNKNKQNNKHKVPY